MARSSSSEVLVFVLEEESNNKLHTLETHLRPGGNHCGSVATAVVAFVALGFLDAVCNSPKNVHLSVHRGESVYFFGGAYLSLPTNNHELVNLSVLVCHLSHALPFPSDHSDLVC